MNKNLIPIKSCMFVLSAAFCFFSVSASFSAVSCKMNEQGISVLSGDFICPELTGFTIYDESNISLQFSEEIHPTNFSLTEIFDDETERQSPINLSWTDAKESKIDLLFSEKTTVGKLYNLNGVVYDSNKNSLSFSIPFLGFNCDIPILLINEIRTEYTKPKCEFIELYSLTAGNLSGVVLESAYDGDSKAYEFPSVNVNAGEFIVVHFRNIGEGCINEMQSDLSLSTAINSSDKARDFWVEDSVAHFGKTDVIVIKERKNGKIIDGVMFYEQDNQSWPKEQIEKAAINLASSELWLNDDFSNVTEKNTFSSAFLSEGVTTTRTINRNNLDKIKNDFNSFSESEKSSFQVKSSKKDWFIAASGGTTPGDNNSTSVYVLKQ